MHVASSGIRYVDANRWQYQRREAPRTGERAAERTTKERVRAAMIEFENAAEERVSAAMRSAEEMVEAEERMRRKREARWQREDDAWDDATAARAAEEMLRTRGAVGCRRRLSEYAFRQLSEGA